MNLKLLIQIVPFRFQIIYKDKNNNYLFMCNVYMNNGDVYSSSMRIGTFTKMNLDMDCN